MSHVTLDFSVISFTVCFRYMWLCLWISCFYPWNLCKTDYWLFLLILCRCMSSEVVRALISHGKGQWFYSTWRHSNQPNSMYVTNLGFSWILWGLGMAMAMARHVSLQCAERSKTNLSSNTSPVCLCDMTWHRAALCNHLILCSHTYMHIFTFSYTLSGKFHFHLW